MPLPVSALIIAKTQIRKRLTVITKFEFWGALIDNHTGNNVCPCDSLHVQFSEFESPANNKMRINA